MKYFLITVLFLVTGIAFGQHHSDSIQHSRIEAENEYKTRILNAEELQSFQGICYFPVDSSYRVLAEFVYAPEKKFKMPMMKKRDEPVYYRKLGIVRFTLHDTLYELAVYQDMDWKYSKDLNNLLFLPFRDATSGTESYGGGRFLDLKRIDDRKIVIDFNLAYNPYCAYSKRYSCPITPASNTLPVRIPAGECYPENAQHAGHE